MLPGFFGLRDRVDFSEMEERNRFGRTLIRGRLGYSTVTAPSAKGDRQESG